MSNSDKKETKIILFGDNKSKDFNETQDKSKNSQKFHSFFRELLKLNNVSFLFGTGPSIPLGARGMGSMYNEAIKKLSGNPALVLAEAMKLFKNGDEKKGDDFEGFLGFLYKINELKQSGVEIKMKHEVDVPSINALKGAFFELCDLFNVGEDDLEELSGKIIFHRKFFQKILTRPLTLRRANIFTTNYDLVIENALDEEGIAYVNGFMGTTSRQFKPESFNYDFYFPATTTEGKVHRLDKMIHLYKLHGSLNWIKQNPTPHNPYGVIEKDIEIIRKQDEKGNIMIYPTPVKENTTTLFPYSDMFRRFANVIQQPQSVLCTIGYGFGDEHINRLIKEALTVPSFHLVIVNPSETKSMTLFLKSQDPRVSAIFGDEYGKFEKFVDKVLPNIDQLEMRSKMSETLKALFSENKNEASEVIDTD